MTRVLDVARIHLVNWRIAIVLPVGILVLVFLLNLAIFATVRTINTTGGSPEIYTTGGAVALYIFALVSAVQAITQVFPFALGLSVTRWHFHLATGLYLAVQAVVFGLLLTLGLVLERATGRWGVGMRFFGSGMPEQDNLFVLWLIFFSLMLVSAAVGMAIGVVFKRWGQLGIYTSLVELAGGAIHGLLGRNGAGKTTLLRILAGLDRADGGEVEVLGAAPWENARVLDGVCLVRDDQVYPETFRVSHVLRAASPWHPAWSGELADDLLARFGLPSDRRVKSLSRGQRSMLGAVVGLASRAPLTLLDEPYLGLDAVARQTLSERLVADHADHPRTIVLSSHLVDEVADLLEHVVVLDAGRVLLDDTADALRGLAVTVSGPAALVEQFAVGRRELHREQWGGRLRVTLAGSSDPVPPELEVAAVSLQQLLVHTTGGNR